MRVTLTTSSLILVFIFQLTTTEIFGQECKSIEEEPWSFIGQSNGPNTWSKTYPTCGGMMQSPIMIYTEKAQSPNQDPLTIVGYDKPITEAEFFNDGIKVVVIPKEGQSRYIEIEGTQYEFIQFHFHWGENLKQGTVHGIDNKFYAMEVHFVHRIDEDNYSTLVVLYEATSEPNKIFEPIVNNLAGVKYKNQTTNYQGEINLSDFLPTDRTYFSYIGSQTNPPCTEGDDWLIFKSIQQVGEDQVMQFKQLYAVTEDKAEPGCIITTNVRPLQKDNGRPVYMNECTKE